MNPTPLFEVNLNCRCLGNFHTVKKMFSVSGKDISDIYSDLCFTNYVFFFFLSKRQVNCASTGVTASHGYKHQDVPFKNSPSRNN